MDNDRFSFADFWTRRARRILPALLTVEVAALIAGWFILLPPDFSILSATALSQSVFATNIYLWTNVDYFAASSELNPLLHVWSLAVEEQYYVLFPPFLFVVTLYLKKFRNWIIFLIVVFSFGLSIWGMTKMPSATFYLLPMRAWELMVGSLLALWVLNDRGAVKMPKGIAESLSWLGIATILASTIFYDEATVFPGFNAIPPVLGTALLIWVNRDRLTIVGKLLSYKPVVWVGLISYSLYLWHWPLLVFAREISPQPLTHMQSLVIIAAGFVMAYVSYKIVETPIRRRVIFKTPLSMAGASAITLIIVAVVSSRIFMTDGAVARYGDDFHSFTAEIKSRSMERATQCNFYKPGETIVGQTCIISNTKGAPPSVLVIGDSHADSLVPVFEDLARKYDVSLKFIIFVGCNPFEFQYHRKHCSNYYDQILTAGNIDQKIDTVFIAPFWGEKSLLSSGSFKQYVGAIEQRLASFKDSQIIFVNDVPLQKNNILEQAASRAFKGEKLHDIGNTFARHNLEQQKVQSLWKQVSRNFSVADPADVLCNNGICSVGNESTIFYRDDDHLTPSGARAIQPILEPYFKEVSVRNLKG